VVDRRPIRKGGREKRRGVVGGDGVFNSKKRKNASRRKDQRVTGAVYPLEQR